MLFLHSPVRPCSPLISIYHWPRWKKEKKMDVPRKQRVKQPCAVRSFHSCRGEYDPEYIKFGFIMAAGDAEQRVLCVDSSFWINPSTAHKSTLAAHINLRWRHKDALFCSLISICWIQFKDLWMGMSCIHMQQWKFEYLQLHQTIFFFNLCYYYVLNQQQLRWTSLAATCHWRCHSVAQ